MTLSQKADYIHERLGIDVESELPTLPVEIVVSTPRIHPWLLKLPGSQLLSSVNTWPKLP